MLEETVKTDVLCIGGGIAGLMAAIRAGEIGAKVIVAEKGNAEYSGYGRMGNDHFETYIPEVHGPDRDAWIEELLRLIDQIRGRMVGPDWEEAQVALQQCMLDYGGQVRNGKNMIQWRPYE